MKQVKKIVVPIEDRPRCSIKGCTNLAMKNGRHKKDGTPYFKKICANHNAKKTADKRGLSLTEYKNTHHRYLRHRKEFCENKDGRLGFKCNYKIQISGQLQVDHKNGNPEDNRQRNLQTLCANCHVFKTIKNKDYSTPGRKTLKSRKLK